MLAVVVQDDYVAAREAADSPFLEPSRELPPLITVLWISPMPGRPRIPRLCPRRNVGRSWPLIRFQAASRISSLNAAGHCSQSMPGFLALGLPVSGASGL